MPKGRGLTPRRINPIKTICLTLPMKKLSLWHKIIFLLYEFSISEDMNSNANRSARGNPNH